ncbi:SNAP protein [Klosneuvirus KNV1]|uniref:Gamma-soluble NSF attachment protein n=1 Tax=Klosneuvirus KNV1 TaxID=1977640 RepID=A0A1V0SJJ8_9VIRU|nr:SNAP protein [Klosneuvirus KNV1]
MQTIETADKLILQGDEEKKSFSLFSNKYEKAFKYYREAATLYQLHKQWDKCAKALVKCLECKEKIEYDSDSPAKYYMDIANCYRNICYFDGYIEYLEKANEIFKMDGNFDNVIKNYTQLAILFEEQYQYNKAIRYYQNVLDIEEIKMTKSMINYYNTKIKLAELYVKIGKDYNLAIKHYDETLSYYYNKSGYDQSYKAPELFLNIMLCYMCLDDEVKTKRIYDEYMNKYHILYNSSEIKLVNEILENGYDEELVTKYKRLTSIQYKLISIINSINKKKTEPDFC